MERSGGGRSGSGRIGEGHIGGGHSGGGHISGESTFRNAESNFTVESNHPPGGNRLENSFGNQSGVNNYSSFLEKRLNDSHFGDRPHEHHKEHSGSYDNSSFINNNTYENTSYSNNTTPSASNSPKSNQMLALLCGSILFLIVCISIAVGSCEKDDYNGDDYIDVPQSTIAREPLPAGSVNETGYYTDELGWIDNTDSLESGMKEFYRATGVQPYVYLTDKIDGNAISIDDLEMDQLAAYAESLYNKLFTDEAHLLLLTYFDQKYREYADYYLCGSQAATVIDSDAGEILLDYVDEYRFAEGMVSDRGKYYGTVFLETANSIMPSKTPWYVWAGIAVFLLIIPSIIVFNIRRDRKKEKVALQAGILETPLKDLGDEEAEALVDKYLTDMNRNLEEIKTATENVSEEEARTKKLVKENKDEIKKLEELAKKALLEGNEPEAKEFLEKKARFEAQEADLKTAYATARANSTKMRQMCEKLTADITELTSRREAIRVKKSIAKTQEAINAFSSNIDKAQGAEGAFSHMEENAEKMVDQVNAMLELNEEPVDEAEALEKKYSSIGTKLVPKKAKSKIKSGR